MAEPDALLRVSGPSPGEYMAKLSLQDLIQAIAGAIVKAQEQVQRFQVATVQEYFDENDRPRSVDVRLPSLSSDAAPEDERLVHVPLLALVGAHLLKIKDVAVEFEVGLGAAEEEPDAPDASKADGPLSGASRHKTLGVDLNTASRHGAGTMARVTLKVEACTPSDGMARLVQHLDKLI